jgi:hypothetical protein
MVNFMRIKQSGKKAKRPGGKVKRQRLRKTLAVYLENDEDSQDEADSDNKQDEQESLLDAVESGEEENGVTCIPRHPIILNRKSLGPHEEVLLTYGWTAWSASAAGGGKLGPESQTALRITVRFLLRILATAQRLQQVVNIRFDILDLFIAVIAQISMFNAITTLVQNYPQVPATLAAHIYAFVAATEFLQTQPAALSTKGFHAGLARVTAYLNSTARNVKKTVGRILRRADRSVENEVFQEAWPPGGLRQLQDRSRIDVTALLERFADSENIPLITTELHKYFMQVLFFSFYVLAPNGRTSGLTTLEYHHGRKILSKGHVLNKNFKTVGTYGFQPVIADALTRKLIKVYLLHIRPFILGPMAPQPRDKDPLWLNVSGTQLLTISVWVIEYSRAAFGLNLNITRLRDITETHAQERLDRGEITEAQRAAICVTEGHSEETAGKYYARKDMELVVVNAIAGYGGVDTGDLEEDAEDVVLPVRTFGEQHPIQDRTKRKVPWSFEEISYLKDFIDTAIEAGGGTGGGNIMAKALKSIRGDSNLRQLFHPNHVTTSSKLRGGVRAYLEAKLAICRETAGM